MDRAQRLPVLFQVLLAAEIPPARQETGPEIAAKSPHRTSQCRCPAWDGMYSGSFMTAPYGMECMGTSTQDTGQCRIGYKPFCFHPTS